MDVDEAVDCTSAETEADTHDQHIGSELQLNDKDVTKHVTRVLQWLYNADGNPDGNGNYRAWVDHTNYEIEFCDGSTSKLNTNIIAKKYCLRSTQQEFTFVYLRKYVITGWINVQ